MFPLKDNLPTDRFPLVTVLLIVANVVIYFFVQGGGIGGPRNAEVVDYGAIPYQVTHPSTECGTRAVLDGGAALETGGQVVCEGEDVELQGGQSATVDDVTGSTRGNVWLTLLTSMFLHGGLLHLLGNMLFLWIFGGNVEDSMSRVRYVAFYLLGGLAAIALQVVVDPDSTVPTIGASGAIAAVLGGYILLYPRARVVTAVFIVFLFTLVELPAWLMLGIWFLEQALVGATSLDGAGEAGGVAYFAHIGGFLFGLLAIRAFARRRRKQVPPRGAPTLAWR